MDAGILYGTTIQICDMVCGGRLFIIHPLTLNLNQQCSPRCRACWLHKQHTKRAPRQEEEEEHKPTAACLTFLP